MVWNKKGQALSLNTIVIAVIVVVVLIVVVSFFLFGFKGLTDQVKKVFFGTTAGTDRTLAIQQCENFCGQLDLLPAIAVGESPYCSFSFNIDTDNDGEAQIVPGSDPKRYVDYSCTSRTGAETLNVNCVVRKDFDGDGKVDQRSGSELCVK